MNLGARPRGVGFPCATAGSVVSAQDAYYGDIVAERELTCGCQSLEKEFALASTGANAPETMLQAGVAAASDLFASLSQLTLGQRECGDGIVGQWRFKETAGCGCDDHVLLPVLTQISDWCGVSRSAEFHTPQFPAGFRIEGSEAAIIGGADEHETAGRGDGPSAVRPSRVLFILNQSIGNPESHAPGEFAGVHVHSGQQAPGRLLAHHIRPGIFESPATGNRFIWITAVIASVSTPCCRSTVFEALHLAEFGGVQEQITE